MCLDDVLSHAHEFLVRRKCAPTISFGRTDERSISILPHVVVITFLRGPTWMTYSML